MRRRSGECAGQKVLVKGEWETPAQRYAAAERILRELANLAKGPAAGPLGPRLGPARAAAPASAASQAGGRQSQTRRRPAPGCAR